MMPALVDRLARRNPDHPADARGGAEQPTEVRAQLGQRTVSIPSLMSSPACATVRAAGSFAIFLAVSWMAGCAALPQFGDPPLVGPPAPSEPAAPMATADSLRVPDPDEWTHVTEPKPAPAKGRPADTPALTGNAEEQQRPDAAAEESKPAPVTVSLPEGEMAARETRAREELSEAKRLIGGLDSGSLQKIEKDKLRTVRGLVEQAERALDEDDIQAAEGLARKAKLLAVELSPN